MIEPSSLPHQNISTIVVSRPGVMQQSLRALLASYPWLLIMTSTGDGLSALNQVAQHQPDLLIVDSNLLDEEIDALIRAVKVRQPALRCLVFLRSSQRATPTLAVGADAVIQRDSPAGEIHATLIRLMQPPSDSETHSA